MLYKIFRFELRQQLKSPLFWLVLVGFGALAFSAAASDTIQIGGGIGNIHRNAPYVVINMLALLVLLGGMFLCPIFVAGAAVRDFGHNTAELVFATPMSRRAYLGGRFAAGWLASVLVKLATAAGMWLGSLMPWLDPARLGPTPWDAYGWALLTLVLPNLFFIGALLFLLVTLTRSMLGTYIGVIAFFVLWTIATVLLGGGNIEHQSVGALIDPFGIGALDFATRYWTPADRNLRMPELAGNLLGNRAIWLAAGIALLVAAFALFNPQREGLRWFRRKGSSIAIPPPSAPSTAPVAIPRTLLRTGFAARSVQFLNLAWFDARAVLRGP